jgi:hypothetical protein
MVDGRGTQRTAPEFDLLADLIAHPGLTFTKQQLMRRVWGWDFGDTSTVTSVVARAQRSPDGRTQVSVLDECGGIAEPDLSRVFDAGWRADPERSGRDAGAGLGLAIAKGIAESHAGSISGTARAAAASRLPCLPRTCRSAGLQAAQPNRAGLEEPGHPGAVTGPQHRGRAQVVAGDVVIDVVEVHTQADLGGKVHHRVGAPSRSR